MADHEVNDQEPDTLIYDKDWEKMYPIKEVSCDKNAFYCIPCELTISCAERGSTNVLITVGPGVMAPSLDPDGLFITDSNSTTTLRNLHSLCTILEDQAIMKYTKRLPRTHGLGDLQELVKTENSQNTEQEIDLLSKLKIFKDITGRVY
ncbi:hypothetical protein RF11_16445 [Thelohanellus kitauei]|uniref:Uncharacterized protein n=1 Tax=Thelohanellus kitauei TaxID=669202 RepID=A0A0C2IWC0_THEKT|nr:hypothetical protein RF11_16445 [Thelohanellus kitauei]